MNSPSGIMSRIAAVVTALAMLAAFSTVGLAAPSGEAFAERVHERVEVIVFDDEGAGLRMLLVECAELFAHLQAER